MAKQFGGKITDALIERYKKSKNWRENKFMNLEPTSMDFDFRAIPKILYKQIFDTKGRRPENPIPIQPFNKTAFLAESDEPKFIWYGHSVLLIRWNNKTILIDPMLGPDAAPIAPFTSKRFSENTLELIDQFPQIDLLLMTHDHYDHLDYASIKKLKSKTSKWFVALGVKRHLIAWGVEEDIIEEFDWNDTAKFENIEFIFTPSRHFSGRGLKDRLKSLWGGWVMRTEKHSLYWSGDGGYGKHFKEIGDKYGPFDFGFIECGQYNENWHLIHMYPEEAAQAAIDAQVKKVMPVHCAGFTLSLHSWTEPMDKFQSACNTLHLDVIIPPLGKQFIIEDNFENENWWDNK